MILIGLYDSLFVRRVAITLKTYRMDYEHRPWSAFGDTERIAAHNPARRVPTLVLADGRAVTETWAILEVLDALAGPARAELGRLGDRRIEMLRLLGFITAAADKAVSLFYETRLRDQAWAPWVQRSRAQVEETLDLLEAERAARRGEWLLDDWPSHADVALGALARFVMEALACETDWARWPALFTHSEACEALEAFRETYLPFRLVLPEAPPVH